MRQYNGLSRILAPAEQAHNSQLDWSSFGNIVLRTVVISTKHTMKYQLTGGRSLRELGNAYNWFGKAEVHTKYHKK